MMNGCKEGENDKQKRGGKDLRNPKETIQETAQGKMFSCGGAK